MSQKKCTVLGQSMAVAMGRRAVMGRRVPAENQWALNLDRNLETIGKTLEEKGLLVPDVLLKQENWILGPGAEMGDPGKQRGQSEWQAGRRGGAGGAGWSSSAAAGGGLSWNGEEERRLEDDWRRGRGVVCCLLSRCIFPRPWHLHGSGSSKGSLCNRLQETPY